MELNRKTVDAIAANAKAAQQVWKDFSADEKLKQIIHLRPTRSGVTIVSVLPYAPMRGINVSVKNLGKTLDRIAVRKDALLSIDKEKAKALGYEMLNGNAWYSEEVDILIPAALENQITPDVCPNISKKVSIILEAANGPVTPDCDELIQERGITLIPDFLCNAGGVTCSYFEQVQCNMNYFWSREEVLTKLNYAMSNAFKAVYDLAKERKITMRDAADVIAVERVVNAVRLRGWI